jgi:hypothetical protein
MSFNPPEPIVSSEWYVVTDLDGRKPGDVSDFVGPISALIERNGKTHRIVGTAGEVDGGVRIYEKDAGASPRMTTAPSPSSTAPRSEPVALSWTP